MWYLVHMNLEHMYMCYWYCWYLVLAYVGTGITKSNLLQHLLHAHFDTACTASRGSVNELLVHCSQSQKNAATLSAACLLSTACWMAPLQLLRALCCPCSQKSQVQHTQMHPLFTHFLPQGSPFCCVLSASHAPPKMTNGANAHPNPHPNPGPP